MAKPVIINTTNELIRIRPEVIVYAISEGNYTTLVLIDLTETCFCVQPLSFRDAPSRTIRRGRFHVYPNR